MRRWPVVAAVAALFACSVVVGGCGDDSDDGNSDAFRIGLEAPLSGDQKVLGQGMLDGAELAAEELNEEGGLLGKDVEIVPIDDEADPETGVEAAEAAIDDGLDGVVGPYNSGVGIETLPLYVNAGLVPIRLTSDPSTNGLGFTLQPMTYQIAPVASRALTEWLDAGSVAIAYDPTQNYTVSVSKALKKSLEDDGVEVTAYTKVEPGEDDYTDVVKELAADGPDVIYAAVYYPEGGLIAKAMLDEEVDSRCVADYASYDVGFVETAGVDAARACAVVGVPAPEDFKGSAPKVAAFEDKFDAEPGAWSPYTYDSVKLLAEGVEQAGSADADALNRVLKGIDGWTGWTGSVTIDPDNGNRTPATVVLLRVGEDGNLNVDPDWARAVDAPYRG